MSDRRTTMIATRMIRLGLALAAFWPAARAAGADAMRISQELDAEFSYVGASRTKRGPVSGNVATLASDLKYVVSPTISRDWLLRFGAECQRFDFSIPRDVTLPDRLQHLNAVIGFDYQAAEQWLVRVEFQPGVYSDFAEVTWRDVDMPVEIGVCYLRSADLQWIFGMLVDPRSQNPVMPAAGARWQFADEWTLNLVLPRPRLEYQPSDAFTIYLGAALQGGTYTVGDHFGRQHGIPKLDNAVMDYLEIRAGPGLAWNLRPNISLEFEAGVMAYREFRFFDENVIYRGKAAPYGRIACRARF